MSPSEIHAELVKVARRVQMAAADAKVGDKDCAMSQATIALERLKVRLLELREAR